MKRAARRPEERGFALLLVFLMAAAVAIMLYAQMPRVAFESQRAKEQLLIDRGQEYVRGIQLYFIAYKKYPSKIEDLENTNNHRYLRHKYIDPMTGKDEWRLIHVNGAGQLTDSLVQKPPNPAGTSGASGASGASGGFGAATTITTGGTPDPANAQPQVNAAVLRRPSDKQLTSPNGLAAGPSGGDPNDPNDPRYWPPISLNPVQIGPNGQPVQQVPGQPNPRPGQQFPGQQFPGQPGTGGLPGGYQPALPGQIPGQLPGQNQINPTNTNGFGGAPQPIPPQVPGQSAFPQPGQFQPQTGNGPNPIANPAVGMIQTMLTTPRQQSTDSNFGSGTGGAAGLAGVATKFTGPSIKLYKDHQKYQEWEFIFDLKQGLPGQTTPNGQQPGQGQQQPGQQQNGQGTFAPSTTFGTSANPTTPPTPPQQPPQQQQQQQQQQN